MRLAREDHGEVILLKGEGKIDIGNGDVQVRDALRKAAEAKPSAIILDLAKVNYMDSSGMGELISAHAALRKRGIELCLTHLNKKIYDLMTLTRMVLVFSIYDSNEDAIQSLNN